MSKTKTVTVDALVGVARSLVEDLGNPEYVRGICELLGRAQADLLDEGEGTAENAVLIARRLGFNETTAVRKFYGGGRRGLRFGNTGARS